MVTLQATCTPFPLSCGVGYALDEVMLLLFAFAFLTSAVMFATSAQTVELPIDKKWIERYETPVD